MLDAKSEFLTLRLFLVLVSAVVVLAVGEVRALLMLKKIQHCYIKPKDYQGFYVVHLHIKGSPWERCAIIR